MAASRRRDYRAIAENAAVLGTQLASMPIPVGPAVGLYRAIRGQGMDKTDKAFVDRLVAQIDAWCQEHNREVTAVGGMPSQWRERLLDSLGTEPPAAGMGSVKRLATTVFSSPLTQTTKADIGALADKLAAAMPELIVTAGDPYGALGALRCLFAGDLANLEIQLTELIADLDARPEGTDPTVVAAVETGLVTGYLAGLIDTLDRDTWTARERDDNSLPVHLRAIQQNLTLERLTAKPNDRPMPVGELAESCDRLVVLGGPGAGKTWAARHIAIRSAESALDQLDTGMTLAEVEVPFFATCSEVLEKGESSWRDRIVNATLSWADDSAGDLPTLHATLRSHAKRLLVLDGLDEAIGLDNRALSGLAKDTAGTTRLVLTCRPGSWNTGLLHLDPNNDRHQLGDLQPFTHHDTIAAVQAWLVDEPNSRDQLLGHLRDPASALSRQARVPLLCAMFCLAARPDPDHDGVEPAMGLFEPGQRLKLYDVVIDKLLRAAWRGITPTPPAGHIDDIIDDATTWLEDLASDGNIDDSDSGIGAWPDAIQTGRHVPEHAARYIDHVAPPVRRRPRTGGRQARWFVHRSLREHLAAKVLCRRSADVASETLLAHLWFDVDWAEVIPNVIAGHPEADNLVAYLTASADAAVPRDPTHSLDAALLSTGARTAPQRNSASRRDAAIDQAIHRVIERADPSEWPRLLAGVTHWPATQAARERIVDLLATPGLAEVQVTMLAMALSELDPPPAQAQQVAERLAERLASVEADRLWSAHMLFEALSRLSRPTAAQAQQEAERLVELLGDPNRASAGPADLAEALSALGPPDAQIQQAAGRLLDVLNTYDLNPGQVADMVGALSALASAPAQAQRLAERLVDLLAIPGLASWRAAALAKALSGLSPSAAQAQQAAERLVDLLAGSRIDPRDTGALVEALCAVSAPGEQTRRQAAERLVDLLATPGLHPHLAAIHTMSLSRLNPSAALTHLAAERLVDLLTDPGLDPWAAADLAVALSTLSPPAEHARRQAGTRLVDMLTFPGIDPWRAVRLIVALSTLSPPAEQTQQAAERLADLLDTAATPDLDRWRAATEFASALSTLSPTAAQTEPFTERLVDLLATAGPEPRDAAELAEALSRLSPTAAQTELIAERLVDLLATAGPEPRDAAELAEALPMLSPTAAQTRQAAERLVDLLTTTPDLYAWQAAMLAKALSRLSPTATQAQQAAERLVDLLTAPGGDQEGAAALAEALSELSPSAGQAQQAAERLVDMLGTPGHAPWVVDGLTQALAAIRGKLDHEAWCSACAAAAAA